MEEREGEDGDDGNGYQALAAWESDWCKIPVFVMSLLQNISFCDKTLLLGRIGRVDLVCSSDLRSDQSSFHLRSVFFFLGSTYEERVGFILDSHGGGSDSIAVFHVLQSSLRSRGCCFTLGDSLLTRAVGGKYVEMSPMKHSLFFEL